LKPAPTAKSLSPSILEKLERQAVTARMENMRLISNSAPMLSWSAPRGLRLKPNPKRKAASFFISVMAATPRRITVALWLPPTAVPAPA